MLIKEMKRNLPKLDSEITLLENKILDDTVLPSGAIIPNRLLLLAVRDAREESIAGIAEYDADPSQYE